MVKVTLITIYSLLLLELPLRCIPTINTRMQMVCTFIGTLCKYTTCIMRSLKRSSRYYWSAVGKSAEGVAAWKTAGSVALRWSSLDETCCSVKPDEARGWVDRLIPLKSSPTCSYRCLHCDLQNVSREHAKCTAGTVHAYWSEASCWLTELIHVVWLTAWSVFLVQLCWCLEADPIVDTARNNSCIVAIVGYHGNPIYRAVAWIPICVSVTSVAIW
jgi:hypothetical protein